MNIEEAKLLINSGYSLARNELAEFRNNEEVVLLAIEKEPTNYLVANNELQNKLLNKALDANPLIIQFLSKEKKNNKSIIESCIKKNPYALYYASDELKNDIEIIYVAVQHDSRFFKLAGNELKEKCAGEDPIKKLKMLYLEQKLQKNSNNNEKITKI